MFEPQAQFDESGTQIDPVAYFADVPEKALLTLGMDAPHSWMVESTRSPNDLDNIFLAEVSTFSTSLTFSPPLLIEVLLLF